MGPLHGIPVLDLSRLLPGPACTAWLVGQGAQVDSVEPVGRGDSARHLPPFAGEVGSYFAATHRGKRSLALDLRSEAGRALIRRMLPRYDVLVEGFKPGVLEAMGLDPVDLLAEQPGLVVARLSGFGQDGPWAHRPGHDINYVGLAGGMSSVGRNDAGIVLPMVQIADVGGALLAAAGIASALVERERTGRGRVLDVSLTEAALWFTAPAVLGHTATGRDPGPGEEPLAGLLPVYGTYRCADGRWLTLGALEAKFQAALMEACDGAMGRDDLAAFFATKPRDHWVDALEAVCVGPVLGPSELADHPHLAARGAVERLAGATWVRPPLGRWPDGGTVPELGEHTDEVLAEVGIEQSQVDAWRADGVVG